MTNKLVRCKCDGVWLVDAVANLHTLDRLKFLALPLPFLWKVFLWTFSFFMFFLLLLHWHLQKPAFHLLVFDLLTFVFFLSPSLVVFYFLLPFPYPDASVERKHSLDIEFIVSILPYPAFRTFPLSVGPWNLGNGAGSGQGDSNFDFTSCSHFYPIVSVLARLLWSDALSLWRFLPFLSLSRTWPSFPVCSVLIAPERMYWNVELHLHCRRCEGCNGWKKRSV